MNSIVWLLQRKQLSAQRQGTWVQLASSWLSYLIKAIDVVKFSVLPVAMMNGILLHGLLWPSKDRGFIHIIPYVEDVSRSLGNKSWSRYYFYSDYVNMTAAPIPLSYSISFIIHYVYYLCSVLSSTDRMKSSTGQGVH